MEGTPALTEAYFRARVGGPHVETEGQAESLLGHRIERLGQPATGTWVEWRWDGTTLTVTRDRFGAFPLYYAASDDAITVSPSLARILATGVSRSLDLDALAGYAACGYYMDADTPFKAVRHLPGGATLTWRPGHVDVAGGPRLFEARPLDRAAIIEGVVETVRAAVARRIPTGGDGSYVMPISGGRDSRHVVLELIRQGHAPRLGVTAGHYPGIGGRGDRRVAARLCATLGIPHRYVPVKRSLVQAEVRKDRITSWTTDEDAWSLAISDALAGTDHTYEGLPGGTLLQRPWELDGWPAMAAAGRFDELASRIVLGRTGRDRFSDLVGPAMRDVLTTERAIARVRRAFEPYENASNPTLEFRFWNRAMRQLSVVPNLILSHIPTVYTPFVDADLIDFAGSIPVGSVDLALHGDIIAAAFPEVAHVPYARFGRPVMSRALARGIGRDLARVLLRDSDGSLVDRARLLRQASVGAVTGDARLATGRRPSLITYLVQLERVVREGPHLAT